MELQPPLIMSTLARHRLVQFTRVKKGDATLKDVFASLEVCWRHAKRLYARFLSEGDKALVHGLIGKPPNRKPKITLKKQALKVYREKFKGFGPTFAAEHLARQKIVVAPTTLRLWLIEAKEWETGKRASAPEHRMRRERKMRFGQMIQMDGSHHDWFEGRNSALKNINLMVMIDDATSEVHARFSLTEDAHSVFTVFHEWCLKYGVPEALYVDRASIYIDNKPLSIEAEVAGRIPETHYARAMRELGTTIIHARSPQAKGRVERQNQTLQDRLVKELRLVNIQDLDSANQFLKQVFLPHHNQKFAIEAKEDQDAHRAIADCLPQGKTLLDVLAFEENRVVAQDWCVQWNNRIFQIDGIHRLLRLPGKTMIIREKLDGEIMLIHCKKPLKMQEVKERPKPKEQTLAERMAHCQSPWKPKTNHPFRRDGVGKASARELAKAA